MIADDEDDTHFCLKCHATILGLDNYVNHRKSGCSRISSTIEDDRAKSAIPSSVLPNDETFSLKADDFFSSLELQSSSKKPTVPIPTGGKHSTTGVLTRSKATAVIQATSGKDYHPSPPPKTDWIGGHQLRVSANEDNQTKLIKAVADISHHTIGSAKKDEPTEEYEESEEESNDDDDEDDYDDDDDNDDQDVPPRSHTGGKWKPTSSPVQWMTSSVQDQERDWHRPPPSHTGGKWKPVPPPQPPPVPSTSNAPPQHYTKGKWKPEEKNFPPPSHTKGKWIPNTAHYGITEVEIPPLRKSNGSVQYWCGPCNRRLASKIVYERHLKSDLHRKRTYQECDFDEATNYTTTSEAGDVKPLRPEGANVKKRRTRKKTFVKCEVCRSRVYIYLMGKHLISHYHCRKGNIRSEAAKKLVLENIRNVVLQSPYQCSMCKFYCNVQEEFLNHWRSVQHQQLAALSDGIYWCSFCQFECRTSDAMAKHLVSIEHSEVISVINRSVPIVIRRVSPLDCQTCGKQFLYNVQLRKHCEKFGHHGATASDHHQKRHNCSKCPKQYRTKVGLQRHLRKSHVYGEYLCNVCTVSFRSRTDALEHRRSKAHKYETLKKHKDLRKNCDYCRVTLPDVMALKEHLKDKHPERKHSCPLCGETFVISQEVASHIKSKSCSFKPPGGGASMSKTFACTRCHYSSDSQSELLFHETLHTEPLADFDDTKKSMPQYKCPVCPKTFSKQYLRSHLRLHTRERPFSCTVCNAGFIRKSNLMAHKKTHRNDTAASSSSSTAKTKDHLCSICGINFKKRSILQQHMIRHSGKQFRCPVTGCTYLARTSAELQPHLATHSDLRPYACQQCDYRAKTKQLLARHSGVHSSWKRHTCPHCNFSSRLASHLNRHLRLHTGAKPFSCPHCEYRCNNLENLRKHVLSTNKHRGKHIYECKFCESRSYGTNFAKDFKMHLVNEHSERFESFSSAATYIAGIYDVDAAKRNQFPFEILKDAGSSKSEATKSLTNDPVVTASEENMESTILLTSAANQDVGVNSKEDVIYIEFASTDNEQWSMAANYDVDESGTLVPFQSEGDSLFQEHFHETL